jgi:hypothetical protein
VGYSGRPMLSTEHTLEILQLVARYNHALDLGDAETWADTFTADGSIEVPPGTFKGRAALVEFARGFQRQFAGTRHWTTNVWIEGDGEAARLRCYLWLIRSGSGETLWTGHYDDALARTAEGWRFAARVVKTP